MNYELFSICRKPFQADLLVKELNMEMINKTKAVYSLMAAWLIEELRNNVPDSNNFVVLMESLRDAIQAELEKCIVPGGVQATWLPMISESVVRQWASELDSKKEVPNDRARAQIVLAATAAFCFELREMWIVYTQLRTWSSVMSSMELSNEFQSYAFWKTIETRKTENVDIFGTRETLESFVAEQTKRIDQALIEQGSQTLEMQNLLKAAHNDTNQMLSHTATSLAATGDVLQAMRTRCDESEAKLNTLLKSVGTAEGQVTAFAASVREELKIDTTKKLWRDRAFWSAISFWVSAGVIAAAILAPPSWAIYHIETVFGFLKRVGDAATQGLPVDATTAQLTAATISRLVVITAPLALYFWAVKLLIRFNTRSMMLMDDARQRHTTLDTYFHLIERSGATTEERGLMLNALFRPLPGQGQDSVEPPNFMELVKRE